MANFSFHRSARKAAQTGEFKRQLSQSMRITGIILIGACTVASAQSIDVQLWPGPEAKKDPRVLSINDDGPCGPIALARVSRLPSPKSKGPLQSERVVELSISGKVLRTWPKPAYYDVLGISGSQLLVAPYGDETHGIWVATTGQFSPVTPPTDRYGLTPYECPRLPVFGNSAYVRCHETKDLRTNNTRRLAYEGPCT